MDLRCHVDLPYTVDYPYVMYGCHFSMLPPKMMPTFQMVWQKDPSKVMDACQANAVQMKPNKDSTSQLWFSSSWVLKLQKWPFFHLSGSKPSACTTRRCPASTTRPCPNRVTCYRRRAWPTANRWAWASTAPLRAPPSCSSRTPRNSWFSPTAGSTMSAPTPGYLVFGCVSFFFLTFFLFFGSFKLDVKFAIFSLLTAWLGWRQVAESQLCHQPRSLHARARDFWLGKT